MTSVNAGTLLLNKSIANGALRGSLMIGDGVGAIHHDVTGQNDLVLGRGSTAGQNQQQSGQRKGELKIEN